MKLNRGSFFYLFSFVFTVNSKNQIASDHPIDLTMMSQDYILETKRINIPGHASTFNPSITRWNESLLMSFRIRNPKTHTTDQIGLIWLDNQFNPASAPYILKIRMQKPFKLFFNKHVKLKEQDPRLLTIGNRLYIVYSHFQVSRMFVAEVHFDGTQFFVDDPECLLYFEQANPQQREKNWVPFNYKDQLLLAYSLSPHIILSPKYGTETCTTFAQSNNNIHWEWGILRGGTPALLVDQRYLAFFHSSLEMKSVQSHGKNVTHYVMGAYVFEPNPPFAITHISPKPIVGKDFYVSPAYKTWKPLQVIFPGGFIHDDKYLWISYGKQDHECWIVKIDKKTLLESLVSVHKSKN